MTFPSPYSIRALRQGLGLRKTRGKFLTLPHPAEKKPHRGRSPFPLSCSENFAFCPACWLAGLFVHMCIPH